MKNNKVSNIVGNGILVAIEIVLAFVSNYVSFGTLPNLNLALIPITIGAILYGVKTGALLGIINGLITLFSPSTQALYFVNAPLGTILVCILKTCLGGILASLIYKAFKKENNTLKEEITGGIVASIAVPILNTGIFVAGALLFFIPAMTNAGIISEGQTAFEAIIGIVLTVNFIIEILLTVVLAPGIARLVRIIEARKIKK